MTGLQGSEDLEVSHFSHTVTPYRETDRATETLYLYLDLDLDPLSDRIFHTLNLSILCS